MKKLFLFLLSLLIGIGLLIWIIESVGWKEIKDAFLVLTGWQGIVIAILTLPVLIIGTLKWKIILKNKGEHISFFNLFRVYLAGFSIMYFLPMVFLGGEIFRGYILTKKRSLDRAKGIASSIIDRVLDWTSIMVIVFLGIIVFLFRIGLPPRRIAVILGGTFLFFLILICFFYFKTFKKESIIKSFLAFFRPKYLDKEPLAVEKEIFLFFNSKNIAMWQGFLLAFLANGIFFLRAWFLIGFLENNIGLLSSFSIFSFSCLAGMIPITAGLGSHEAIQVFVFKSLGLGGGSATAFTMITRGAELIFALLGICIFFRLGSKLLEGVSSQGQKINKIRGPIED